MLPPGIAGAIAMMITNVLHAQFSLEARWVALALSFAIGLVAFADRGTMLPRWQRCLFYVLNSLIIFSMAVGTNSAAGSIASPGQHFGPSSLTEAFFARWFPN
jgi:hypothetical protein